MKVAVTEPVTMPIQSELAGRARRTREDQETPKPICWGALYAILLASVVVCVGGIRLVAAVGHSALIEYGAALAIVGLLFAWVRNNRSALSRQALGVQTPSRQPFSVIQVPFSPRSLGRGERAISAPPDTAVHATAVCAATEAPHR